jgi:hypothetical protein
MRVLEPNNGMERDERDERDWRGLKELATFVYFRPCGILSV